MKLFEVKDEFESFPTTVDHLFRVQMARTYEFTMFCKKTNFYFNPDFYIIWVFHRAVDFDDPKDFSEKLETDPRFSDDVIEKLVSKYTRMIQAKNAFEDAGGEYRNYSKKGEHLGKRRKSKS